MDTLKRKDNPKNKRKVLHIMYLIRDLYIDYKKNSKNFLICPIKKHKKSE